MHTPSLLVGAFIGVAAVTGAVIDPSSPDHLSKQFKNALMSRTADKTRYCDSYEAFNKKIAESVKSATKGEVAPMLVDPSACVAARKAAPAPR